MLVTHFALNTVVNIIRIEQVKSMKINYLIIIFLNDIIIYSTDNSEAVHQLLQLMQAHCKV